MRHKWIAALGICVLAAGLTACGGKTDAMRSVSGASVETSGGTVVEPKLVNMVQNDEREPVGTSLKMPEKKQLEIIADNKKQWNMGLDSDIEEFAYSVTDFDQDGYLEIFVRFTGGTGHFTVYEIYEVDGDSGKLVRWKCEEEVTPDFAESPMRAFYDEKAGEWHLDVYDSLGQSAGKVGTTWYDLTLSGCGVQAQEYRSQMSELKEDNEFDFTYYGKKGEEVSEAEYGKLAGKQYERMKKAYISFADGNGYRMESSELEKMGRKELLEELGDSLGEFAAEWAVDLTAWEAALPEEEMDCLRQIAQEIPELFYINYDCFTNFLSFFVTDLDENGRPELLLERSVGSGIIRSYMSCYELPEEGGGMRQAEMEDPECSYLGFGGEMEVIRDKKMGDNQYVFDVTGFNDNSYSKKSKCRMSLKDHRFSMREEKLSKAADGGGERDSGKEKKETVRPARMNVYGAPCEDYVYEKVFVSWLAWTKRDRQ